LLLAGTGFAKNKDSICRSFSIVIPDAFTPNGDGPNDSFQIKGMGIASFEVWVFDKTGKQIFNSTDINKQWGGEIQGTLNHAQCGKYRYQINVVFSCGYKNTYTGGIWLID
jgi:gliding motility-associated-like protein